jgi:prepilin-type N-terminal cleavage/methylation domain-containing protein
MEHWPPLPPKSGSESSHGFTLVELLLVVGIIGLLLAITGPIWNTLSGSSNIAKSSSDIQNIMEQARSYAMANNTYTYVGIWEVDLLKAQSGTVPLPQGIGRVAIGIFYSPTGLEPLKSGQSISSANTAQLGKLNYFENLHITDLSGQNSVGLLRPTTTNIITSSTPAAPSGFQWPLTGTVQYPNNLVNVIEFSPQGCARVLTGNTYDPSLKDFLELGLMPAHGNTTATNDSKNSAVLQINGTSGAIRLYRPSL